MPSLGAFMHSMTQRMGIARDRVSVPVSDVTEQDISPRSARHADAACQAEFRLTGSPDRRNSQN